MIDANCLFCKIVVGKIPSSKVFENERVIGFIDLHPLAQEHYLFIHKDHTKDINQLTEDHPEQIIDLFKAIKTFTEGEDLAKQGFRVVTNLGQNGGQSVFHTHFHLLGGETLGKFGR